MGIFYSYPSHVADDLDGNDVYDFLEEEIRWLLISNQM